MFVAALHRNKNKDEGHLRAEKIVAGYFSELYHKNYDKIKTRTVPG